jgi:hypothetical protein
LQTFFLIKSYEIWYFWSKKIFTSILEQFWALLADLAKVLITMNASSAFIESFFFQFSVSDAYNRKNVIRMLTNEHFCMQIDKLK